MGDISTNEIISFFYHTINDSIFKDIEYQKSYVNLTNILNINIASNLRSLTERNMNKASTNTNTNINSNTNTNTSNINDNPNDIDEYQHKELFQLLSSEVFEVGETTDSLSYSYFSELLEKSEKDATYILSRIHGEAIINRRFDVIKKILMILSHTSYQSVSTLGPLIVTGSLSHKDNGVVKEAIRCIEYWKHPKAAAYFSQIKIESLLIKKYADMVSKKYSSEG